MRSYNNSQAQEKSDDSDSNHSIENNKRRWVRYNLQINQRARKSVFRNTDNIPSYSRNSAGSSSNNARKRERDVSIDERIGITKTRMAMPSTSMPPQGDSDEDTDSEQTSFHQIAEVDLEYREGSSARRNVRGDAENYTPLRRSKIFKVNDNIEEQGSGVACRTRAKTGAKRMVEPVKVEMDSLDESSSSSVGESDSSTSDYFEEIAEEINTTSAHKATSEEDLTMNGNGEREGGSLKVVSCEHPNREEDGETETRIKKKSTSSRNIDLCIILANDVLERGPQIERESDNESNPAPTTKPQTPLPLKFRFEDEASKQVEKTKHEQMVDECFDEMYLALAMNNLDSSKFPEADSESGCSPFEETQDAQCTRRLHEWILEDDEGLYCIYCGNVELEPRDILPQWVHNTRRKPRRRIVYDTEEVPEFGERYAESSETPKTAKEFDRDIRRIST